MRAADALAAIRALPIHEPGEILQPGPLLVLTPHPDDESLATGGLIARESAAGRTIHVALLTDGTGSHPNSVRFPSARLAALREAEIADAITQLGLPPTALHLLRYPDRYAPREGAPLEEAAARVRDLLRRTGAANLVTAWIADPHADHEAAALIARRAVAGTGVRLLHFPVWGLTLPPDTELDIPPVTGARIDVTGVLPIKRAAIAAHRSQMTPMIDDDPHGFCLDPSFIDLFTGPHEILLDG